MEHEDPQYPFPLPIDVNAEVFRNVLQDSRFQAWKVSCRGWQLHISGGPGSGKTTLATMIARQLWKEGTTCVVLIHVYDEVPFSGSAADPLTNSAPQYDPQVNSNVFANEDGSTRTGPINVRSAGTDMDILCAVLASQLCRWDKIHLIIDGYDRIEPLVQSRLQRGLRQLQPEGLHVLLLNAVAELDAFPAAWPVSCDKCNSGSQERTGLLLYWVCNLCPYDLCDTCKAAGEHCGDHTHIMSEPYDVVHMKLTSVPAELEIFVRADLEAEYGTELAQETIEAVCEPSDGNMNLAKLRLDQIRDLESPLDILSAVDRLPREVVAFFDSEVSHISLLEPMQKYQTLLALIAVAETDWMSVKKLEELLEYASGFEPGRSGNEYPLVRQVLTSARGLLSSFIFYGHITSGQQDSDRHRVALYLRDLGWYIREHYNQDLVLARQYLGQARTGKRNLDRSYSFEMAAGGGDNRIGEPEGSLRLHSDTKSRFTNQASSTNIVGAILQDPGDICTDCQKNIFRSTSTSGLLSWLIPSTKPRCPICLYAYEEMSRRPVGALGFRWAIRTMGRTSNSNNHLVLSLRPNGLATDLTSRRFVFMLKSEAGTITGPVDLGKTTALEDTGKQIRKWLHTCQTEHQHCNHQKRKPYVPKRLVDIDTGVAEHCRVIEGKQKAEGPYVTLSHSWGANPIFLTLTTKNKQSLMTDGFSTSASELNNKNFEEAIKVARYLGVRYIWIDSLCICQSGKDKDFKEEGQYMHLVYQNSFCNIAAADSRDAKDGLFRDRHDTSLSVTNTTESWVVLDKDMWAKELLQSPIYTRGWVFQERMLSPRIIHFTRSQIFWDCSTLSACETLPEGLPFALASLATTDRRWRGRLQRKNSDQDESGLAVEDSLESFWKTAVLSYTSCDLTNQADKTFAIWSIAKLVRDNLQHTDQYGCGLWSIALHEQLAWQVKISKSHARMDALQSVFPSWSWASVNAPIQIQDRIVAKRCYTIKNHKGAPLSFSDFKDKAMNRDIQPQFEVSDSLAVRAHLVPGRLSRDLSGRAFTFECAEACLQRRFETIVDEEPTEALLRLPHFYLLPLVAQKTNDHDGMETYAGNALVLITTQDYRKLVYSRLMKKILQLVLSYGSQVREIKGHLDLKSDSRMLRREIDALNACLRKVDMQDQNLPSRSRNAYRRVGVVRFGSVAAKEWANIMATDEQLIWLD